MSPLLIGYLVIGVIVSSFLGYKTWKAKPNEVKSSYTMFVFVLLLGIFFWPLEILDNLEVRR